MLRRGDSDFLRESWRGALVETTESASGGFNAGALHGYTDEFCCHAAEGKITIRDIQATLLHQCRLAP